MRFKPAQNGKVIGIVILVFYVSFCSYSCFALRDLSIERFALWAWFFASVGLFLLHLQIKGRVPEIIVLPDGIFIESRFMGRMLRKEKIYDLDSAYIKLKRDEIRVYSLKKHLFLFRPLHLVVVNRGKASFLKRMSHFSVEDFDKFTEEVFKRVRHAEIDEASFNTAKEMNLSTGTNINVVKRVSLRKSKSLLDEFQC